MSVRKSAALIIPVLIVLAVAVWAAGTPPLRRADDPWQHMPPERAHLDHAPFFQAAFEDGPAVTRACLTCHEQAARDFMRTSHWTWHGDAVEVPGHAGVHEIGKKNLLNNFCGGIQANWPRCTSCHAGYGWEDDTFDFGDPTRVDCLVCHDTTGMYRKAATEAGRPAGGVDLLAAARAVGVPTRENCGVCHFQGGGGDAVKHGDMDGSMYFPPEAVDVHMGRYDFQCTDCHRSRNHELPGRSMSVSIDDTRRVRCIDCHDGRPHGNERLDDHTAALACQSCHIPRMALRAATKTSWDWSTAGRDDGPEDHTYSKKKGTFTFAQDVPPEYYWYDGRAARYLLGDEIDPTQPTKLNRPRGTGDDPRAKIWPFKVMRGKQVYDKGHRTFQVPKTFGQGGYWEDFDWDKALRLGSEATGLEYSGSWGFAETEMYWPLSHMVQRKEKALQCTDCHGSEGRMDWKALGYTGDPAVFGGRRGPGGGGR
jgi:octaheme c-type cytochrome (tetrathionate reductase family)